MGLEGGEGVSPSETKVHGFEEAWDSIEDQFKREEYRPIAKRFAEEHAEEEAIKHRKLTGQKPKYVSLTKEGVLGYVREVRDLVEEAERRTETFNRLPEEEIDAIEERYSDANSLLASEGMLGAE